MYIIVGLGNPGTEYARTRHNIGYMVLDKVAAKLGLSGGRDGFRSTYLDTRIGSQRVVLAKPTTYMNNSGYAVSDLMNWFKCEHSGLVVVCDDIDLPAGDIRIRAKGSSGTHNGLRSIIYQLGYDDFPRIRVGVGKQKDGRDLVAHVLGVPDEEDMKLLNEATEQAAEAVLLIAEGNLTEAQARFNKKKSTKAKTDDTDTDKKPEGGE